MKHATARHSDCPPVRLPREANVTTPSRVRSGHQVGRSVRAWLDLFSGDIAIAVSWVFFWSAVLMSWDGYDITAVLECAVIGSGLLGFGVGWHFRGDGGRR